MAIRKRRKQRPFHREALEPYALGVLRPRIGPGAVLWRYTITIPLEEIRPRKEQKATADDLESLQRMLAEHFGGFTRLPESAGFGLRDAATPQAGPELNFNTYYAVLASPVSEADIYFRALRTELAEALDEGVILVERQEVWIP